MQQVPGIDIGRTPADMPAGLAAVPIQPDAERAMLRVCVIVRTKIEPAHVATGGPLVVLREFLDGRVYLGCVTDAAGKVQRWLELWVQDVEGLASSPAAVREAITNARLDARWSARTKALAKMPGGGGLLALGFEDTPAPPTAIDPEFMQPVELKDPRTQLPLALCTDDALLQRRGLPPYSSSLSRCLWSPQGGESATLFAVTPELEGAGAEPLADLIPRGLVRFNAGGGRLSARTACAMTFDEYADFLSVAGRGESTRAAGAKAADPIASGWGTSSRAGRAAEVFHLKVRAIAEALAAVRDLCAETQAPLLNLSAASFGVQLGETGWGLPTLWTARVVLGDPGDAIELPVQASDSVYFLPGRAGGPTIYSPANAARGARGKGTLRLRKVTDASGGIVLEATLASSERLAPGRNDLIWLRANLGGMRADLYANADADATGSDLRIRTLPQRLSPDLVEQLRRAEGVMIPDIQFEVIPLLSTPCDLYGLGVLAARMLIAGGGRTTLAVAIDDLMALATLAGQQSPELSPGARVRSAMNVNPALRQSLGATHLLREGLTPEQADLWLPPEVWSDALAATARLFPGVPGFSLCRDLGDAAPSAPHRVFDRALEDWSRVVRATRALVINDVPSNREVAAALRRGLDPSGPSRAGTPARG